MKIYDHVIWEGHVFSIMELCEGGNLRDWIRRHQRNNMIKEVVCIDYRDPYFNLISR